VDRIAPWLQRHWDDRAAGNFVGGGIGSGLAVLAALLSLSGGWDGWPAFLAAGLFICAGLSLVWLEIGRPWRFLHVFFNPRTSWMTREALVAPPLLAGLGAAAWFGGRAAATAVLVLALAFLYSQARVLRASTGIPAWREPRIVPLIVATGLAEGAGGFLVIATIFSAATSSPLAIGLAAILVGIRWIAWTSYRRRLAEGRAPTRSLVALQAIQVPFITIGVIAPLLLLVVALVWPGVSSALAAVAGLLATAAGWLIKRTIVTRAAFNQGFALPHLPLRGVGASASGPAARPGWS
jgi:phenylacetyl-CoA:acceptor oxidoreductase 26-kDa subunit